MSTASTEYPAFADTAIDRVRDYWNRRPCNLRHSPAAVGSREYFEQVGTRKYFVEPHIPGFAQFERWAGRRVLEVGCGLGTDTMNFARAGADVTAVDLSSASLDLARRRAELFGLQDRITFVEADAERLSEFIEPAHYDLVYSFGAIHHTPRPERALDQIRRFFIGPQSTLKLMVYYRWSWKVFSIILNEARGAFWRLDEVVARHSEAQTGCPVTYTYTKASLRRWLQAARFHVDDMFVDHIFPYRVPDYVTYRYVKEFPFSVLPGPVMRALERRLGWHLCVTARPVSDGPIVELNAPGHHRGTAPTRCVQDDVRDSGLSSRP